jgi:TolB protein
LIADADGRNGHVLVENVALESNPSFSPDGQWVLFTSRRGGSADIYRVHTNGKGLERLTDHPAFDDQAAMAPDGDRVAFVSSRSGQADIWKLDLKTKRSSQFDRASCRGLSAGVIARRSVDRLYVG